MCILGKGDTSVVPPVQGVPDLGFCSPHFTLQLQITVTTPLNPPAPWGLSLLSSRMMLAVSPLSSAQLCSPLIPSQLSRHAGAHTQPVPTALGALPVPLEHPRPGWTAVRRGEPVTAATAVA